jgi:hypothetical protein
MDVEHCFSLSRFAARVFSPIGEKHIPKVCTDLADLFGRMPRCQRQIGTGRKAMSKTARGCGRSASKQHPAILPWLSSLV